MDKILISCKEARIENNRSFYGCFSLGPFEAGQSLTIANALRRTLLSEGVGLGITATMIENVHHEYSTLPNVRDSVLDILLNLKEIVLKKVANPWNIYEKTGLNSIYDEVGSSYFKPVIGYLKVKGPGVIRARDLRLPPFIQCVDPNQYIATLTDDGLLNMKFVIMEGKNYFIQKSNTVIDPSLIKKREKLLKDLKDLLTNSTPSKTQRFKSTSATNNAFRNASFLNIDSIFNPVTKVNYIIEAAENQLVKTSFDKSLFLDDLTALLNSSVLLKKNLPFLKNLFSNFKSYTTEQTAFLNKSRNRLDNLDTDLARGNIEPYMKNLLEYVENLSTSELNMLYNALHPLRKGGTKHNITLEIWTNGSIHPRDALSSAFYNLSFAFLNFQKTKIVNPMFTNSLTYKETYNVLSESTHRATKVSPSAVALEASKGQVKGLGGDETRSVNTGVDSISFEKENRNKIDIGSLNLSLRSYTKLKRANIQTIADLATISESELTQILDKKSLFEVKKALAIFVI